MHCCLREPPAIVGLETAAAMNLVQIGTNEFFPNSPLLNSREPSTTTQDRRCSHLSNPPFTQRSFPTGIRDGGRREPREPRLCSLGRERRFENRLLSGDEVQYRRHSSLPNRYKNTEAVRVVRKMK